MQDAALPQSVTKSLLNRKHSHCMSVQTMKQSSKILITIAGLMNFLEDWSVAEESMELCGT